LTQHAALKAPGGERADIARQAPLARAQARRAGHDHQVAVPIHP
jgi:hypothetical protein